jgi:hypothetical protein
MKKNIRILSVIFLTVIYCFAIVAVANSLTHSDNPNNPISSQENIISDFSVKLFYQTSQSESSGNSFKNLPVLNFKNPFTGLWAIIKITEQFLETEFSQYKYFARNILINHRKSDIIFPFHYFW